MGDDRQRGDPITVRDAADSPGTGYSLLVVAENGTALQIALVPGAITIGRAETSDVRLDDASVSRQHARLTVGTTVQIEDLGSRNGVRVRGELLPERTPHEIAVDEVVGLGTFSLIVRRKAPVPRPLRLWSHDYFVVRLEDECARAERFGWSFALVHAVLDGERSNAATRAVFATVLRTVDVVGAWGPGEYHILLVDVDRPRADRVVTRLVAAMRVAGVAMRTGVVEYPRDGRVAGSLAAAARALAHGVPEQDAGAPLVVDGHMRDLHQLAARVAASDLPVLLLGETGTGKEVFAEVIHRASPRADRPLVRINCAALPEPLLESELFGHEKGAFTGATATKPGLLETADGGTVFLDEVGELPAATQAKLLRVLEAREVQRVGGLKPRPVDVRFIAATNRDLASEIARDRFRADLYYRLDGVSLSIPPIRERRAEIEPLARRFIAEAATRNRRSEPSLDPDALALLLQYDWPGNIRELRNTIERAVLLSTDGTIAPAQLPVDRMRATVRSPSAATPPAALTEEAERIRAALERCGGNQTQAARELGMSRRTLVNRLNELDLPRPKKRKT